MIFETPVKAAIREAYVHSRFIINVTMVILYLLFCAPKTGGNFFAVLPSRTREKQCLLLVRVCYSATERRERKASMCAKKRLNCQNGFAINELFVAKVRQRSKVA